MSHKVLAVNAGSSSLKFQLFEMPGDVVLASGIVERIGINDGIFTIKFNGKKVSDTLDIPNHSVAVELVLKGLVDNNILTDLSEVVAVGHRVVHGGENFKGSVFASEENIAVVEDLADLAPLHNPANLVGYHAFKEALPKATHTLSFDTAFHQTMKPEVYVYPLPYEYYTDLNVRRYGMHGISHQYVSNRLSELEGKGPEGFNVITLHLGNGASISAVKDGVCINTSMGFTPLAGIMMGTRTGDVDPAIVTYLMRKLDKTAEEIIDIFNKKSGMLGVSGLSSDARDIENAIAEGNERAILTRDIYAQRVLQVVGGYALQLGHVDAIAFTAGVGENDGGIREAVLELLGPGLNIQFDKELNAKTRGKEIKISTSESDVAVWVVPTNEELVIATDAYSIHNSK
ncbi:acetate kinase [Erysipelothrix larvae]|uniref:Acetate kinase n=1 Tax=Erysipelothrix larvae TaxID=1514105 RepID=A0A0X8GZV8_9FIRM|nr:acetate kinase [Erysipelothrix larvae]AMC93299.1 acetate kinase [Erysipelothrix larvae]